MACRATLGRRAPESAGPLRKVAGALRIFGVLLDVNLHFTG
jgi:hypothetical protein